MKPPDNAEEPSPGQGSALNSALSNANNNAGVTVQRRRRVRHVSGQLPLVLGADVHEPRPGRKTADVFPHKPHCPRCGYERKHLSEWPAPALATKNCPACRYSCEFTLYPVKAKTGRKRAA